MSTWMQAFPSALFCLLIAAAPASADLITSGTITSVGSAEVLNGNARFSIAGDDFSLTGALTEGGGLACFPCGPGPRSIAMVWGGNMGSGSGTVGGVFYPTLFWGGSLNVNGTAVLPTDGASSFDVTFPFTVAPGSFILGFTDSLRTNQVFSLPVTGSGTATMGTTREGAGGPLYDTRSLSFDFAPTPEPATVWLLGIGGLAGIVAFRRRARSAVN